MRKILFISIFVLLLLSKLYAYSKPLISGLDSFTIMGTTDYVSVGLDLLAIGIGIYLSLTAKGRDKILNKIKPYLDFLLIVLTVWFVISIIESGLVEVLYSPVSPLGYLPIVMLLLATDEECWKLLKKTAPWFGLIYVLLCYTAYQTFVVNAGMRLAGNSPVTVYLVSAVWWLAVSVIDLRNKKMFLKILVLALLVSCALIAFSMTYRSWIIQSVLLMFIAVYQLGRSKSRRILWVLFFLTVTIYGISEIITSSEWSESVTAFEQKSTKDTRSFQYEEMFNQIPLITWILGGGFNATYISIEGGDSYKYIDNQYLFTLFHYGIFLLIPWLMIWLKGVFGVLKNKRASISNKSMACICILWLCALGGLSVYNVIIINSQNIIMSIILGRCYLSCRQS